MKNLRFIALALVFCILFLCGCAEDEPDAYSLLVDLMLGVNEEPGNNGYLYSSKASEGDVEYLPGDILVTLYGEKYLDSWSEMVEECAIFLSARDVCEIAVFKCYSRSDTALVTTMLFERADELKVALRHTEWEEQSGEISIEINGKYLLFALTHRSEELSRDFKSLV